MLSVTIPVYNFDINSLVASLHGQLTREKVPFEIILLDDGSKPAFKELNRAVKSLPNVLYEELEKNVGRSRIRNLMAQRARYDQLLFLDCDSEIEDPDFIRKYLKAASPDKVLYGGRSYVRTPPADRTVYFRWKYGIVRETAGAAVRNTDPYLYFLSNNFVIPRAILLRYPFNENLSGYGHEDTLLAFELRSAGIPVLHLDNPATHVGLESAPEFLKKTEQSIANLKLLMGQNIPMDHIKLVRYYVKYNRPPFRWLITTGFRIIEPFVWRNLQGPNPRLVLYDCFKLAKLLEKKS